MGRDRAVAGVPVTELLGGYGNRMRVAHMIGFGEPAETVAEAARIRDTYGITTFKVKVGRHPIDTDVAACRALREALGDDVELYVDGNRGWTAADAARALRAMADLDLRFAEELCPADDVLCRRWLVKQSTIPIFADEWSSRPGDVTRELLGESANGISIKTARTGFSTLPARAVPMRRPRRRRRAGQPDRRSDRLAVQPGLRCRIRAHLAPRRRMSKFIDMSDDLLAEPLEIKNGSLRIREAPGLGIKIDEHKLAHYRTDN